MPSAGGPGPELSSMTATLQDVARRVVALAEGSAGTEADTVVGPSGTRSVSQELFEVERSLNEAVRRLSALTDALR
jgi:hypothetical protein